MDDATSVFRQWGTRLGVHRYPLLAAVAVLIIAMVAAIITPVMAISAAIILVFVTLFAPLQTGRDKVSPEVGSRDQRLVHEQEQTLLNALPDPVLLLDMRGAILFANTAFDRQFGTAVEGTSVRMRFRAPEMQAFIQSLLAGETPKPVDFAERSQVERWFRATALTLRAAGGAGDRFGLTLQDMTELHRIDRMRSDFIANASHELRTPLASMTGFIETLAGPAKNDAAARKRFLPIMLEQAGRMSRLIDDLLSLSRFESGQGRGAFQMVDLSDVLSHVVDALKPMAKGEDIALNLTVPDNETASVNGNRDELVQLFENLVENAIKYGGSGGVVDVSLARAGTQWQASVADKGPGIDEEHIPRLTERFYRVDVEKSRGKQGTGLGLAIVKHIAGRHGARLRINSQLGQGTTFHVTFRAS